MALKYWFGQKLKKRKGFSLTELLAAVLILSMVSAVVAGGIPVAKDAYEKITLSANAQVMLSTTISALRNVLCTARDIEEPKEGEDGSRLKFFDTSIQNYSLISKEGANSDLMLTWYADYTGDENKPIPHRLVSLGDQLDEQLHVTFDTVSYEDGIVSFKGMKVVDKTDKTKAYAQMKGGDNALLKIRLISE